jgi:hypothetical protein
MASYTIPVKGGGKVEVDSKELPDNVYNMALSIGLKDLVNRGMTKVGPLKVDAAKGHGEAEVAASAAKALEIAQKNLANLKEGKLPRMAGVKASDSKIPGVVMTEARRLAKNLIKDEIKKAGGKISHYEPKDITAAANALLAGEDGKDLLTQAQANVDARAAAVEAKPAVASIDELQAKLGISVSADKVAKANEKKAKAKAGQDAGGAVLSAAKAGQLKTRTKAPATA